MHRIDSSGAIDGQYTNGNGGNIPATAIDAAHLNALQNEIVAVIESFGISLEKGNNTQLLAAIQLGLSQQLPAPGGYLLSNNVGSPLTRIDIAAGSIIDSTRTSYLIGGALTKRLDTVFTAGDNGGLRPVSVALQANRTYHLFVVELDGGGKDYVVDTDISASHIIADIAPVKFARVGFLITDDSMEILPFFQHGPLSRRVTIWKTPQVASYATAGSISFGMGFPLVPLGKHFCVGLTVATSAGHLRISCKLQDAITAGNGKSNVSGMSAIEVFSDVDGTFRFYSSAAATIYGAVEYVIDSLGE